MKQMGKYETTSRTVVGRRSRRAAARSHASPPTFLAADLSLLHPS